MEVMPRCTLCGKKKLKLRAQACNHVSNTENFECYINPKVMITLYTTQFANGNSFAAE
jgi:hypothetical protein